MRLRAGITTRLLCLGLVSLGLGTGCFSPFRSDRDPLYRFAPPDTLPDIPRAEKPAPVPAHLTAQERLPVATTTAPHKVLLINICPSVRDRKEAIENIRLLSPSGERVSLAQLCDIQMIDGASEIYRESNQRYVAIKYSVRGRDLGGAVEEAIKKVHDQVKLPTGYHLSYAGEYESQQRAATARDHHSADPDADFPDSVLDVQIDEMGVADLDERGHGAGGRVARAVVHAAPT